MYAVKVNIELFNVVIFKRNRYGIKTFCDCIIYVEIIYKYFLINKKKTIILKI